MQCFIGNMVLLYPRYSLYDKIGKTTATKENYWYRHWYQTPAHTIGWYSYRIYH